MLPVVKRSRVHGFSLIEIIFALVIVSTVLAIAIPRLQTGLELQLKAAARKLTSAIHFAYGEAAFKRRYYRIVFSMNPQEGDGYWLEAADKPVLVRTSEEEEEFQRKLRYLSEEKQKEVLEKEPQFARLEDHLSKEIKLPSGIHFKDVFVEYQRGKIERGLAYLYFFPNGFTQKAVINVEDKDGNTYGLEVSPLSGKVRVEPEYLEYEKL